MENYQKVSDSVFKLIICRLGEWGKTSKMSRIKTNKNNKVIKVVYLVKLEEIKSNYKAALNFKTFRMMRNFEIYG